MLEDSFHRIHDYLRISVTDRCNLRCTYCMPAEGINLKPKETLLTYSEITRLAELFVGLGVRKIRVTGGEPLVRQEIETLFDSLGHIRRLEELAISTNGVLLESKLPALWNAGVSQINISLDTLRADRFLAMTRRSDFPAVLRAIRAAAGFGGTDRTGGTNRTSRTDRTNQALGFRAIKINAVVIRDTNDDELVDFIRFAMELSLESLSSLGALAPTIEIRFIEYMPFKSNAWAPMECVSYREMRERVEEVFDLEEEPQERGVHGPAKSFGIKGSRACVGFITSMTEDFCSTCNRLRLTSDGNFRTCLFGTDSISLRDMMRSGATDTELEAAIRTALYGKWAGHPEPTQLVQISDRDMVMIGG